MAQFFKSALKNRTLMKFFSQKLTERSLTTVGTLGPYRLYITVHKEAFRRISNAITYVTSLEKLPFVQLCTIYMNPEYRHMIYWRTYWTKMLFFEIVLVYVTHFRRIHQFPEFLQFFLSMIWKNITWFIMKYSLLYRLYTSVNNRYRTVPFTYYYQNTFW